jgi:hypothetical protein
MKLVRLKRKVSIIIPTLKTDDKTDCNNYRGISLLSIAYEILSVILPARLAPYINKIIGDHQLGYRRNRSAIDQIFFIRKIQE